MNAKSNFLSLLYQQGIGDIRYLSYIIATVEHETAGTFRPILERYNGTPEEYFKRYDYNTAVGNRLGNNQPGDGLKFRGRGHVQLTGRSNYARFTEILGVDLIANPDLALDENISVKILVKGMVRGIFTGKALRDYINDNQCDYLNARRIVNGTDRAKLIADKAIKYEKLFLNSVKSTIL